MNRERRMGWKRWLAAIAAAAAMTATAVFGVWYYLDNLVSDLLFQKPQATQGNVIVIGIDNKALDDLGPFQNWSRDILAMAVEALNEDPEHRPAAIGLDILFAGETDPEADAYLAQVCRDGGNVVTASAVNFTDQLKIREDGTFYMDGYAVESVDLPYEELHQSSVQGHINAMYDADGILRHSILRIDLPDGEELYSFAWELSRMYAETMGLSGSDYPPMDARYRWYVPFSMMPGGYYEGYSVSDLLAGEVPPEVFEDKIVLIGPYSTGLSDYVTTAIDRAQLMYGVEFQANVVDALLDGNFKREAADSWQYLALFFICLGCILGFRRRHIGVMTGIWLLLSAGYVVFVKWMYEQGQLLHVLWIPLAVTCIFVYYVAANYLYAAAQKRKITVMFKRYVAPEIVNEILKEGADALQLGGKLTDIAVLFVDLRGFTTMSEALPPEEVVKILNRYLTLTSGCVIRNKGTLDKFVGDCTMAIWGAPLPQEDAVYLAVKAALDMIEGAKELGRELEQQFGKKVEFGIGVHWGPAVVGNIGSPERMDFTAIGDTVNTAARLEANAPGGTVYISRAVADALEGKIKATSLGSSILLKGKAEGFEVLVLEGLADEQRENTSERKS